MSVEIKDLYKSFGEKVILSSFSCNFPDKGVVAVTGDSGVGKTTLLRLISGLDKDYNGQITGGGIGKVSFAFQEHRLFPSVSALDNIVLVCFDKKDENSISKSKEMLSSLGFSENDMKLKPAELSGGMKQRVSLARAFLKDAPTLLLDEPTKELDKENIALVIEEIKKQAKKRLVIIVTHRSEDIEQLDAEVITI